MKGKVRKSACIPAPPPLSDPAIVKATLTLGVVTAFTQLPYTIIKPSRGFIIIQSKRCQNYIFKRFLSAFCKSLVNSTKEHEDIHDVPYGIK